jgi:multiple sugar transport system ATP-binding protein
VRALGQDHGIPAGRADGRAVEAGVRPEDVRVSPAPARGAEAARVVVLEPMGNETIVTLERGDARLVARAAPDPPLVPGQEAWVAVTPGQALLFDAGTGERVA